MKNTDLRALVPAPQKEGPSILSWVVQLSVLAIVAGGGYYLVTDRTKISQDLRASVQKPQVTATVQPASTAAPALPAIEAAPAKPQRKERRKPARDE